MPTLVLLGSPVLVDDADAVVTGRPAQRHCLALLALLAGERRGLARERAVSYLWPECSPPAARHRLSVALHVLRSRLGDNVIGIHSGGLSLNSTAWRVDAWSFEEDVAAGNFESALARYSGPLLDGFFLRYAPDFERWLERWRDRLARRYLAVLNGLAAQAESAGKAELCIEYRRELTAHEPCSGASTVALMRSLSAAGRSDEAIRCARAYTLLIREDYGLEPDPAVLASVAALTRLSIAD